jgi:(p)ppGpp synthase/HD superfamily hydrolase
MTNPEPCLILTERFTSAVEYARTLHTECRKGTRIPYMAHLLGVASLVMGEVGGRVPVNEDMVIAAVLHDVVEDHGGKRRLDDVEEKFGPNVARLVEGLSDTLAEDHDKKEGWEERKTAYIKRLRDEGDDVLLICAADKLYNAKAILDDLNEVGAVVWERFNRGPKEQLRYLKGLLAVFEARMNSRLIAKLRLVVDMLAVACARSL